jgi:outer membrane protein OmpA-like peptidoglycan-associated protein
VKQQNAVIHTRLAQLEERTDQRFAQVDGRVSQVASQTTEARRVADQGVSKANAVDGRVTKAIAERNNREAVGSTSLRFASGQFALQAGHKEALDQVYALLVKNPTFTADIIAQADRQGAKRDNVLLSWRRQEHVRRYLAEKGDVLHRLYFVAVGEDLADAPARQAEHRDVSIKVYKPTVQ